MKYFKSLAMLLVATLMPVAGHAALFTIQNNGINSVQVTLDVVNEITGNSLTPLTGTAVPGKPPIQLDAHGGNCAWGVRLSKGEGRFDAWGAATQVNGTDATGTKPVQMCHDGTITLTTAPASGPQGAVGMVVWTINNPTSYP